MPTHSMARPDFMSGGQWFVDALKAHGVSEKRSDTGDRVKLRLSRPLIEAAELQGDFRIAVVSTTGAAQVFKSVLAWNLGSALITVGQLDFLWAMPQASLISKITTQYWRKIIPSWEGDLGLGKKASPSDSKSTEIYQSALGTGQFAGANNPNERRKRTEGTALANTNIVSVSIDLLMGDEVSQYPIGVVDVLRRRLEQSRIATRPERWYGTPGGGAGIEKLIEDSDYNFYSHARCDGCGQISPLHPLGWLVKNVEQDKSKPPRYFDPQGRPIEWHCRDISSKADRMNTAYFGCPICGHEISRNDRLNSWFQCLNTGVRLRDLLDSLPKSAPDRKISAGITLSPLIRDSLSNSATDVIRGGAIGDDPFDWQQQGLGIPTSSVSGGITISMIQAAINRPVPMLASDEVMVYGLDQGTTEHWIAIVKYLLPWRSAIDPTLEANDLYEQSHRVIVAARAVSSIDLEDDSSARGYLRRCKGGAIDQEPGRDWAAKFRRDNDGVVLFDQRPKNQMQSQRWKEIEVESGARKIPAIAVDTHQFQSSILGFFDSGLYTIECPCDPTDIKSRTSLTRHLVTSTRDGNTGLWTRPDDNIDDWLKALMGAELWFYLWCHKKLPSGHGRGFWGGVGEG